MSFNNAFLICSVSTAPSTLRAATPRQEAGGLEVSRRVRKICSNHGVADRIPRLVLASDKRVLNKRIVERLASQVYTIELEAQPSYRIRAWRKAAWAIEDLEQNVGLVYNQVGSKGLEAIPQVGPSLAREIGPWIVAAIGDSPAAAGIERISMVE